MVAPYFSHLMAATESHFTDTVLDEIIAAEFVKLVHGESDYASYY